MGFWFTFFLYAGLTILSDLLRPKPDSEGRKPADLGDFRFPTATEQRRIPMIWGTVLVDGPNVTWYGDLLQEAITQEVKSGWLSSDDVVVGFRYHLGVQQSLCMGPLNGPHDGLLRVYIGEQRVLNMGGSPIEHGDTFEIDRPFLFGGEDLGQGGVVGTLQFFAGTNDQAVSSYLANFQVEPVTGDTPAYRDVVYTAPATEHVLFGSSTSIKPWKWELRRIPNGLALGSGHELVDGGANIANVFFEILTNTEWGYAELAADINSSNFTTVAATLHGEGNGFSFLLDSLEELEELVLRLEEQIDGGLYKNPLTGKWEIWLARADYDIGTVPEINATNLVELRSPTTSTWADVASEVNLPFADGEDDYRETYGFAQNMAVTRILGTAVPTEVRHPGVKRAALANALAWRELRTLSQPLFRATFFVDRSLYGTIPGDVLAFTDEDMGFVRLPVRVTSVDYGDFVDGRITINAVQDVFFASAGTFADPPPTAWEPPAATLVAYPADEQLAFEAPRGMLLRDINTTDPLADKIFAAARRQGTEVSFKLYQRNDPTTPAGDYAEFGEVFAFMRIGELAGTLNVGATNPVSSVTITPTPDTQSALEAVFPDVLDVVELGTQLETLCLIGNEFVVVQSAQTSGANVQLNNVYRGVLDSVQEDHAAGTPVYLLFVGAGLGSSAFPAGNVVDVKLLPRAFDDTLDVASATAIQVQLANRTRRPYPPASFDLNGTTLDTTSVDLDGSGSGEDAGVLVDEIVRRDFRTVDEIAALAADAATIFADFPSANSTTVELEVRNGVTVVHSETSIAGTSTTVRQLDVLQGLDTTSLPASLTIALRESHTLGGVVYTSRYWLTLTFSVASPLVGKHAFGALDQSDVSTVYEVQAGDDGTDHDFTLSTSFAVGDVEYRLDGGTWTTLIGAGGTTGTIPAASLSVGTDIEIRHGSTDVDPQKLLTMDVGGTIEAYAVLFS